ncbi:MAG: aminodeoxychorismate/anthranilate synthase component II [Myxococcota bacterium]|jgi:anthranilate synthase component 2
MNVLFIDNFDSFSFNLVDEFRKRGCAVDVWRNDISTGRVLDLMKGLKPPVLAVISPGPGSPAQAGCCIDLIKQGAGRFHIFGVCLGHQAMVEAFGGVVGPAGEIVHGKSAVVGHDGSALFKGIPNPFKAARYHSLAARTMPGCLKVTATAGSVVMAVEHRSLPVIGVQFHPESILTPHGGRMIENVIRWAGHA